MALTEKRTGTQASRQEAPKRKSIEVEKDKGKGKNQDRQTEEAGGKPRCRFFLTDGGCRKGKLCGYAHEGRDEKKRCWNCGGVDHFAPACARPKGSSENSSPKARTLKSEAEGGGSQKEAEVPSASTSESSIKEFVEEANKMLKNLSASNGSQNTSSASSASTTEESKEETVERLQQLLN